MKKAKRSTKRPASRARPKARKPATSKKRTSAKPIRARKLVHAKPSPRPGKGTPSQHARSAAKMAASVFSRRAAKAESLSKSPAPARPPLKLEPRIVSKNHSGSRRSGAARSGRSQSGSSHPGGRSVVRVSRVPQYNYMRAPGADSGFDVGDSVEVLCDHEQDGERVRGWIKGVVVQVDNKLVAVQFRSNVFLTDGWMVPDRILWYSLTSDQIRGLGLNKRAARAAIPEY